jgi:hypothetical protein
MRSGYEVPGITEEQLLYAKILAIGMYSGLALLLVTFTLYVSGIVEPGVPIERLPEYWTLSVDQFLEVLNEEHLHRDHHLTGWWWISALGWGDYMNFVGIVLLAAITIVCYVGITPTLLKKRDWVYATIAIVEIVILVLAASGLLAAGH